MKKNLNLFIISKKTELIEQIRKQITDNYTLHALNDFNDIDEIIIKNKYSAGIFFIDDVLFTEKESRYLSDVHFNEKPFISLALLSDNDIKNASNVLSKGADDIITIDEQQNIKTKLEFIEKRYVQKLITSNQFTAGQKVLNIIKETIKNPFGNIVNFSNLVTSHLDNKTKVQNFTGMINKTAQTGFYLQENLFQWSKIQTNKINSNPENINIKDIINSNYVLLKGYAKEKNIDLIIDIDEDFWVYADSFMISTVFRNILHNAIKYSVAGKRVFVSCEETDENSIQVSVADSGKGIPEEKASMLFNINTHFTTPGTDDEKGTGLGLLICKHFMDKTKGKLWFNSVEGQGSEFGFDIPLMAK